MNANGDADKTISVIESRKNLQLTEKPTAPIFGKVANTTTAEVN
jgi:hypothetical protein